MDYSHQARTYDATRAASPSVLAPLAAALAGAPGRRLLDVGGGTGNYALALGGRGWEPTLLDSNADMLAHARAKGLPVVLGDATALPYPDGSWDAVALVSMLHHVPDWRAALAEVARVLRPQGRLAVMGWTREHIAEVTWLNEYFPSTREWLDKMHPPQAELLAELPGARALPFEFTDREDASLGALQRWPETVLDPELRRQTSYFEKLGDRNPDELRRGLTRLQDDLRAGRRPDEEVATARSRWGDAAVIAWSKPDAGPREPARPAPTGAPARLPPVASWRWPDGSPSGSVPGGRLV